MIIPNAEICRKELVKLIFKMELFKLILLFEVLLASEFFLESCRVVLLVGPPFFLDS
jgi:hypothetical protein